MNKHTSSLFTLAVVFLSTQLFGGHQQRSKPYCIKGRFYNHPREEKVKLCAAKVMFNEVKLAFGQSLAEVNCCNSDLRDISRWQTKPCNPKCSRSPRITWVGHSTMLIQIGNVNILTDPIFGNINATATEVLDVPFKILDTLPLFFKSKRIIPAAYQADTLPPINAVLITHSHYDHLDEPSIRALCCHQAQAQYVVPKNLSSWFEAQHLKARCVHELCWWQSICCGSPDDPVKITFVPSHHSSSRSIHDKNKVLWGSFVIQYQDTTILFVGDSGADTDDVQFYKEIHRAFPHIDVLIISTYSCPTGSGDCWSNTHADVDDIGTAFLKLNAKTLIPCHWGAFKNNYSRSLFTTPIETLSLWWRVHKKEVCHKELALLKVGQTWCG